MDRLDRTGKLFKAFALGTRLTQPQHLNAVPPHEIALATFTPDGSANRTPACRGQRVIGNLMPKSHRHAHGGSRGISLAEPLEISISTHVNKDRCAFSRTDSPPASRPRRHLRPPMGAYAPAARDGDIGSILRTRQPLWTSPLAIPSGRRHHNGDTPDRQGPRRPAVIWPPSARAGSSAVTDSLRRQFAIISASIGLPRRLLRRAATHP